MGAYILAAVFGAVSVFSAVFAVLLWRDGNRNGWTDAHAIDGATFTVIAMIAGLITILILGAAA